VFAAQPLHRDRAGYLAALDRMRGTLAPDTAVGLARSLGVYVPGRIADAERVLEPIAHHARPLDLLAALATARYVLDAEREPPAPLARHIAAGRLAPEAAFPDLGAEVLVDREALPRAYLVEAALSYPGRADLGPALLAISRRQPDLRRAALIEGEWLDGGRMVAAPPPSLPPPGAAAAPARAERLLADLPDEVLVEADVPAGPHRSLLVLADLFAPGWSAEVDGQPARMVRANLVARGVPLDPGRHQVRFTYRAPGLRSGAAISATALLTLVVLWLARLVRAGKPQPSSGT
jgi:hypothetical protein